MKANELRVGNWVSRDGEIYQASSPTITALENGYFNVEPVIISTEWLTKFGFEYINKGDNDYILYTDPNHDYYLQMDVRKGGDRWVILDNTVNELTAFAMVDIVHVHQLQNLYFALTGEELKYKFE